MTKIVPFRIVNVFAESTFGGNPLAVIEQGDLLNDSEMQHIARQFNLSETTFLLPSTVAAARVRIFTPGYEMAFAGHPTLGSAHVVRDLQSAEDQFNLELQAGMIEVKAKADRWQLKSLPATHRLYSNSDAELADALGLPAEAIAGTVLWLSTGNEQLMVPLASAEAVHAARPNAGKLSMVATRGDGRIKVYVFARTPEGFVSRFFWSPDGGAVVMEDPGTGSACANLGGYWQAIHGASVLQATIEQGHATGRLSRLSLGVSAEGAVWVGGRVIEIARGTLSI